MSISVDALVRGTLGTTSREVEGRVVSVSRTGSVVVIRADNGRQGIIYQPEVVGEPRPAAARRDIPERFK